MKRSYWRERCKGIIYNVLKQTEGASEEEIKKALQDAYPFGERAYHPYKIWLSEIKAQRKLRKPKPTPINQTELF